MHSCLLVTPSPQLVLESVKAIQYDGSSTLNGEELLGSLERLGNGSKLHHLEWGPMPEQQGLLRKIWNVLTPWHSSNIGALSCVEVAFKDYDPDAMEVDHPSNTSVTAHPNTLVAVGVDWATARQQVHEHIYWNQSIASEGYELFQLLYTACYDGQHQQLLPGFDLQQHAPPAPPEIPGVSRSLEQVHFAHLLELLVMMQHKHDSSSSLQEPPATSNQPENSQVDSISGAQEHPLSDICHIMEEAVLWYCAQGGEEHQTINHERVEQLHLLPWHIMLAVPGLFPPAAGKAILLVLLLSEPSKLEELPEQCLGAACAAALGSTSLFHSSVQLAASSTGQLGSQQLQLLLRHTSSVQEIILLGILFSHHQDMPSMVHARSQQLFRGVSWRTLLDAGCGIMPAMQLYMPAQQRYEEQKQKCQQQPAQQQEQPSSEAADARAHPAAAAASAALMHLLQQELADEAAGEDVSLSVLSDIMKCCIRQVTPPMDQQQQQQQQQHSSWPQLVGSLPELLHSLVPAGAQVDAAQLMEWLVPISLSTSLSKPMQTDLKPHADVEATWQWQVLLRHAPSIAGQLLSVASRRQPQAASAAAEPAMQPGCVNARGNTVRPAWESQQHLLQRLLHPSLALRLQELAAVAAVPPLAGKALLEVCEQTAQQVPVHVLAMELTRASSYAMWKRCPASGSSTSSSHASKDSSACKPTKGASNAAESQGAAALADSMQQVLQLQQHTALTLAGQYSRIAPSVQWHQISALPAVQLLVPAEMEELEVAIQEVVESGLKALFLYASATAFQDDSKPKPHIFVQLQLLARHTSQLKQAAQPPPTAAAMDFSDAHMTANVLRAAERASSPTSLQLELGRLAGELPLHQILASFDWFEMFGSTLAHLQAWLELTAGSLSTGDHEVVRQLIQQALEVVQQDANKLAQKLYPSCCDRSSYRCGLLLDEHAREVLDSSSHLIQSQLFKLYFKQQLACIRPAPANRISSNNSSNSDEVQHVIKAVQKAAALVISVSSSLCSGEITWTNVPQVYKHCMSAEQLQQEASILANSQNPPADVQRVQQHLQLCQAGSPWVWQQLVQELLQFCQAAGFSLAAADIEGLQQQLGSSFEWPSGDRLPLFAPEGQPSVAALRQQLHTELHRRLGLVPQQCSNLLQHHELLQPLGKFVKELRLRMSSSHFCASASSSSSSSLEAAVTTLRVRCLSDRSLQPAVMQLDNLLLPASMLSSMDLNITARQLLPHVQFVLEGLGASHRSASSLSQMPIQPLLDLLFSQSAKGSISSSQLALLLDPSARLRISVVSHSGRSMGEGDFCVQLLKADGKSEIVNPASQCEVMLMALNHSWPNRSSTSWQPSAELSPDAHLLDRQGQQMQVHRWELLLLKQRIEHLQKVAGLLWQLQQLGHPVAAQRAANGHHSTTNMVVCEFMPQPCLGHEKLAQVLTRQESNGAADALKDMWRWEQETCAPYLASSLQQLLLNCQSDLKRLWQLLPWTALVPAADLLQWQGRRHLFWNARCQQWAGTYCRLAQNIPAPWQHWKAVAEQAQSSAGGNTFFSRLCMAAVAIISGMMEAVAANSGAAAAVAAYQQAPSCVEVLPALGITAGKGTVLLAVTNDSTQRDGAQLAAAVLKFFGTHQPGASFFFSCNADCTQQAVAALCYKVEQAASLAGIVAATSAASPEEAESTDACLSPEVEQCLFIFNAQALSAPDQEMLAAALLQLRASQSQMLVVVTCADNDCRLAQLLSNCLWAEAWQWLAETIRLGTLNDARLLAASPVSIICGPPLSGKTSQAVRLLQQTQRSILRDQHWQISISQDTTERQLVQMLEQYITNSQQSAATSAQLLVYMSIGCNIPCIAANLGGTLLSLLTCGVAGQGIDVPLHLPANTCILLDVEDLKQFPLLALLPDACVTQLPFRPLLQAPAAPGVGLEQLAQQLELQQRSTVTDEDVICCLVQHWPPGLSRDQQQQQVEMPAAACRNGSAQPALAFTYTPQVLRRLAQVHSHIVAGSTPDTQPDGSQASDGNSSSEPAVAAAMPSSLPVVLVGDTGCGKTYLLQKLVELYGCISRSYGQVVQFRSITISQASSEAELCTLFREAYNDALMASNSNSSGSAGNGNVWFYLLDEVNTTPALDFCKRLLVERVRTLDAIEASGPPGVCKLLPNLIVMATCNPRSSSAIGSSSTQQYDVLELPPSLEAVAIKYAPGSMTLADKEAFVSQHLQHRQLQAALFAAQQLVQQHEGQPITMRDTQRFLHVLHQLSGSTGGSSGSGSEGVTNSAKRAEEFRSLLQLHSTIAPAPQIDGAAAAGTESAGSKVTTGQVLALYLCYGMQLQDRFLFYQHPEVQRLGDVAGAISKVQQVVFDALQLPQHIIPTPQLLDNLTAMLLATFLGKPLLVMGDPGVSKSLALSLLMDRMRGQLSDSPLLAQLPRLQPFWLQMSPQTTASSLRQLADAALDWSNAQQEFSSAATLPAIILEELSMAPRAATGPLKALHYLLDKPLLQGGQQLPYGFFATSNYSNWGAGAGSSSGSQRQHQQQRQMPFDAAICGRMLVLKLPAFKQPGVVKLAVGVAQGCMGKMEGLPAPVLAAINAACAVSMNVAASSTANASPSAAGASDLAAADSSSSSSSRVVQEALLRDLLHFSCSLARQLPAALESDSSTLEGEQVKSFLLHMQLSNSSKTARLVQQMIRPGGLERLPSQQELLQQLLSPAAVPARHILLVYTTALQLSQQLKCITAAMNALEKTARNAGRWQEAAYGEESFWVHGNRPWYQDCGMWSAQGPSAASRLLTWVCKTKAGLEQGAVLVFQHPQCLLPSLHAVLNASFAAAATHDGDNGASSGQLSVLFNGNNTESLVVHRNARIVLLVHAADLQLLHPSVISRLSVLHLDLPGISKGTNSAQQLQQRCGLGDSAAAAAVPLRPSQLAARGTQLAEKLRAVLRPLGDAATPAAAEPGNNMQLQGVLSEASELFDALETGLVDVLKIVRQSGRASYVNVVCSSPVTGADWCHSWDQAGSVAPAAASRPPSQLERQQRLGLCVIVVHSYLTTSSMASSSHGGLGPRRGVGLTGFTSQLPPEQQLLERVQGYLQQCIAAEQQRQTVVTLVLDLCGCGRKVVIQCLSLLGLAGLKASSMTAELMGDTARNHHKLVKAAAAGGRMQLLVACDPVMARLCAPAAVCRPAGMSFRAFWLESRQPAIPEAGSLRQLAVCGSEAGVTTEPAGGHNNASSSGSGSSNASVSSSGSSSLQQLLDWLHGLVVSHVALLSHLPPSTQQQLVSLLTAAVERHWPLLGFVRLHSTSDSDSGSNTCSQAAVSSATSSASYTGQVLFVASLLQLVGQLSGQEHQLRTAGSVRAALLHQLRACVQLVVLQYLTRLHTLLANTSLLSDALSTGWLQQLLANNAFPWQRSLSQQLSEANNPLVASNTVALSAQFHTFVSQVQAECSNGNTGSSSTVNGGTCGFNSRAAALGPLLEGIVKLVTAVTARGSASGATSAATVADACHSAFPLSQSLPAVLQDAFVQATVLLAYSAHDRGDGLPCSTLLGTGGGSSSVVLPVHAQSWQQQSTAAAAIVQHGWDGSLSHLVWVLLNYSEHIAVACGLLSNINSSGEGAGSSGGSSGGSSSRSGDNGKSATAVWGTALYQMCSGRQGAAVAAPDVLLYALLAHALSASTSGAAKNVQLQLQLTPALPLVALQRVLQRPCPIHQVPGAADVCLILHLYVAVMLGLRQRAGAEDEHSAGGGGAAMHVAVLAAAQSFMNTAASASGCRLTLLAAVLPKVQQQQVAIMLCQALLQAEANVSAARGQQTGRVSGSRGLPTRNEHGTPGGSAVQGMQFYQHSCVLLAALLQRQELVWLAADFLHKLCWPQLLLTGAADSSAAATTATAAPFHPAAAMAPASVSALRIQDLDAAYKKCKQLVEGCFCREVSCKPHVWASNLAACCTAFFNAWLPPLPASTVSAWLQQQLLLAMIDVGQNRAMEMQLSPTARQEAQQFVGLWVLLLAAQWLPRAMATAAVDGQLQLQPNQQLILLELLNGDSWGQSSSEVFKLVLQPLRNYCIRLLLQRFDTTLLPRLSGCIPALGPWSQQYFTGADAAEVGMWLPLLLLPSVLANVKQQAIAAAADGIIRQLSAEAFTDPLAVSAGSGTAPQLPGLLPLLQGNAELRPVACFAAYWLHLVASEPGSVFHWSKLNPASHQQWLFPAMPEDVMAMMRRLAPSMGITAFNRCRCGATYGNGECGMPNQVFTCASCGQRAGGTDHGRHIEPGNQLGLEAGNDGDVLYGISIGDGFDAPTCFERDMSSEQYRIVLVLLLTVMAVSGAAGATAGYNQQYSQHLKTCLTMLQQFWGVSAADVQLLLLYMLQRCNRQLLLQDVAHRAPLHLRAAGELQFQMERRLVAAMQQHCPELFTAAGRQQLLQQAQQVLESEETRQLVSPAAALREQAVQALHARSPAAAAAQFASVVLTLPQPLTKLSQLQQFFVGLPQQEEPGQQQQQQVSQDQLPLLKLLLGEQPERLRCALLSIYYLPAMCAVWGLLHDHLDAVLPLDGAAEQQPQQQQTLASAALRAGVTRRQLGEFVQGWNAVSAAAEAAAARYDCQQVQLPSISTDSSAAQVVVAEGSVGRGLLSIMCAQHNMLVDAIVCACKHPEQAQQLCPYAAAAATGLGGSHPMAGDGRSYSSCSTQLVSPALLCSLLDTYASFCASGAAWPAVEATADATSSSAAGQPRTLAEQLWQQLCRIEEAVARQYLLMRPLCLLAAQSWPEFHYKQAPSMVVHVAGLPAGNTEAAGHLQVLRPAVRDLLQQLSSQEEQHQLMGFLHKAAAKWNIAGGAYAPGTPISKILGYRDSRGGAGASNSSSAARGNAAGEGGSAVRALLQAATAADLPALQQVLAAQLSKGASAVDRLSPKYRAVLPSKDAATLVAAVAAAAACDLADLRSCLQDVAHHVAGCVEPPPPEQPLHAWLYAMEPAQVEALVPEACMMAHLGTVMQVVG